MAILTCYNASIRHPPNPFTQLPTLANKCANARLANKCADPRFNQQFCNIDMIIDLVNRHSNLIYRLIHRACSLVHLLQCIQSLPGQSYVTFNHSACVRQLPQQTRGALGRRHPPFDPAAELAKSYFLLEPFRSPFSPGVPNQLCQT